MSRNPSSAGFTLVEVVVALASVSVLVAGASGLLLTASSAIRSARSATTATLLALQKIEQVHAAGSTGASAITVDYFSGDGTPASAASAIFVRRSTTQPLAFSPEDSAVSVEVFEAGVGRVADLSTILTRVGGGRP